MSVYPELNDPKWLHEQYCKRAFGLGWGWHFPVANADAPTLSGALIREGRKRRLQLLKTTRELLDALDMLDRVEGCTAGLVRDLEERLGAELAWFENQGKGLDP